MQRSETIPLRDEAIGFRSLLMLCVAVAIVVGVAAVVFTPERALPPAGSIGYRTAEREIWIDALGHRVNSPRGGAPVAVVTVGGIPNLGEAQFPAPDRSALAFVTTVADRYSAVSLLMLKEGDRLTQLARIAGDGSPPLITGDKGGARSADGVPLVVAWSPDGRYLAWGSVNEPPYNLHVAARETLETRSLPLEGGYAGELSWSPDSRYLAISTYAENRSDHTLLVFDTLSDEPPRRLAKGCVVVWSPDSRHLVLHGEPNSQPGLLLISVGGKVKQIVDRTDVAPFAWLPD